MVHGLQLTDRTLQVCGVVKRCSGATPQGDTPRAQGSGGRGAVALLAALVLLRVSFALLLLSDVFGVVTLGTSSSRPIVVCSILGALYFCDSFLHSEVIALAVASAPATRSWAATRRPSSRRTTASSCFPSPAARTKVLPRRASRSGRRAPNALPRRAPRPASQVEGCAGAPIWARDLEEQLVADVCLPSYRRVVASIPVPYQA